MTDHRSRENELRRREIVQLVRCAVEFPGCHEVQLGKRRISLLGKRTTRIHPAIDFVDGKAFIGLFLPTRVIVRRKPKDEDDVEEEVREEDHLWLVTSDREIFYAGDYQTLRGKGYILTHKPLSTDIAPRWSIDDLAKWLARDENGNFSFLEPDSVYLAVRDAIAYYMEFPDSRDLDFWTLIVIGSYFVHLFDAFPIGYVGGIKRVGKTKLLLTLSSMAFNGVMSASLTAPSLFRIIQDARATLFVDETETLFDAERNQAFRALILAAYKRGQAAHRVEGGDGEARRPIPFELYASLYFANIQGLENVLEDRAISRILLRAMNPEIMRREPSTTDPRWGKIRNGSYRLCLERAKEVRELGASGAYGASGATVEEGGEIGGREQELWRPILTLAAFFEKHGVKGLCEKMMGLAKEVGLYKAEEDMTEATDMLLLQVLHELVTKDDYYAVSAIKEKLIELVADDPNQPPKWLNASWIGRALKRMRIGQRRKLGTHREYRITPEHVRNLITRAGIRAIEGDSTSAPQTPQAPQAVEKKPLTGLFGEGVGGVPTTGLPAPSLLPPSAALQTLPTVPAPEPSKLPLETEKPAGPEKLPRKQFHCKKCGKTFDTRCDIEKHMVAAHDASMEGLIRKQREEKWGRQESEEGEEEDEDHGNG